MAIFYSDERGDAPSIPYDKINAVKGYLRHYSNMRMLDFIAKESKDGRERGEARKELEMAHRKMGWMEKHRNFDAEQARIGVERINRDWSGKR